MAHVVNTAFLKNRVFTVGFRIGKSGRATGVRVRNIKGGQTNRRDANKLMKSLLTSWVFEPIVVGGEKLVLEGLYIVIDYGVVRKFRAMTNLFYRFGLVTVPRSCDNQRDNRNEQTP